MEPKLGADLSSVRVHTGGDSATAAKGFGARAFTVGSDVHFNAGEFSPGTKEGDKLLAHELTHVVQGQKSGVQRKPEEEEGKEAEGAEGGAEGKDAGGKGDAGEVSDPNEPAEKEADAVGDKVGEELHAEGEEKQDAAGGAAAEKSGGKDAKGGGKDAAKKGEKAGGKDAAEKGEKAAEKAEKGAAAKGGEKGDAKGGEKAGEKADAAGGEKADAGGGEKADAAGGEKGDAKGGPAEAAAGPGGADAKGGDAAGGEKGDAKGGEAGEGAAKAEEKPAPIAAKLSGIRFKIYRSPPGVNNGPPAPGGAPANPAAPAAPATPTITPEKRAADLAAAASPAIEVRPEDGPVTIDAAGAVQGMKSDSPDPIKLKDEIQKATAEYLAMGADVAEPVRQAKLTEIKNKFALLRTAMAHARGEDDKLVQARVKFEKMLGTKCEGEWPQGTSCVETMVGQAKSMIVETEGGVTADAGKLDEQLQALPDAIKIDLGKKLGIDINMGFAGAVGKTFHLLMETLDNGSLVQKAQTLINFSEKYLAPQIMKQTGPAFARAAANVTAAGDPEFDLAKRLKEAEGKDPKAQYKILCTSPLFMQKLKENKAAGAGIDAERGGDLKLGGDMDTKIPQQPIENLTDQQLDFVAQQGTPQVDLKDCKDPDPDKQKAKKVAKLKAAGIHVSKAPGGAVDATSINEDQVAATVNGITIHNKAYIEGKLENIVDPKSKWIMDAVAAQAPLKAGISGTTARFTGAAVMLGGDKNGAACAMLGHLQAIEAHSFWEIVQGAGLAMSAGKYTPFPPNDGGMKAAASEFVDANGWGDLGANDKKDAEKKLLGEK